MSGHSKWSTIKRAKGITDAKRGALFTKVAREISVAARQGGGDPDANYRLRLAIEKARSVNMPADNIKRTIDKATGGGDAEQFEEIVYEGYGPGGVAVLVEAQTDNRNRTAAEVRSMFAKSGGQLAGSGAVAWQFEPRGLISVPRAGVDADEVALTAIDAGAEDVDTDGDETIEIYTSPGDLEAIRRTLEILRRRGRLGRVRDDRQADRRARLVQGAPGPPARGAARGPRRRPAGDGQLRHPRRRLCRGRRVKVLGIDPGTAALGYGIVERSGGRLREIDHGCLTTSPDLPLPERLLQIHALVDELLALHQPDLMGVERLFFSRNVQTALGVGQARGVVLLAAAQHGTPVREATPSEVKSAIAGYGAADKEQVQRMVQLVLGMSELPRPDDAADALAIATWVANTDRGGAVASAAVTDRAAIAPITRGETSYERAVREALAAERAERRIREAQRFVVTAR